MFPKVNKVLEFFLKKPTTTIHIRELARQINMTPAGCLKSLKKLVKEDFIDETKTKALSNYKAKHSKGFIHLKKIYNIFSMYDSKLVEFLEEKYESPEAIIVFGSYARGEDTEQSDIDIVIITKLEKSLNLKRFENILERKINIFEIKNIKKAKKEFISNLVNGIVLEGVLQI